jgi:hypothetical protein
MAEAKMVSLELSKKEAKAELGSPTAQSDSENLPRYPYGTQIRLDTELLKKLGIDLDDYPLGTECTIQAKGKVVDTSASQRLGGKERQSMEIQMTEVFIGPDKAAKKQKAKSEHLSSISSPTYQPEDTD